ncbi:MAG: hypothetical protein CL472_05080 [Acidobacteria bacterium]|nr:hypothetical protein [Acidobacteriota bacterium]
MTYQEARIIGIAIFLGLMFLLWAVKSNKRSNILGAAVGLSTATLVALPGLLLFSSILQGRLPFQEIGPTEYETLATISGPEDATVLKSMLEDGAVTYHEYNLYLRDVYEYKAEIRAYEGQIKKDEAIKRLEAYSFGE